MAVKRPTVAVGRQTQGGPWPLPRCKHGNDGVSSRESNWITWKSARPPVLPSKYGLGTMTHLLLLLHGQTWGGGGQTAAGEE